MNSAAHSIRMALVALLAIGGAIRLTTLTSSTPVAAPAAQHSAVCALGTACQ